MVTMRLWTLQPLCRLSHLERDGVIYGHPDRIEEPSWALQYNWMVSQMAKRIPNFSGRHPIWAHTVKPDLRLWRHWGKPSTFHVRLEIEVPDTRCLISDYSLWHNPLNRSPVGTEAETDVWDLQGEPTGEALYKNWERIFDLDFYKTDPEWFGSHQILQVCMDGLKATEVIKVDVYRIPS